MPSHTQTIIRKPMPTLLNIIIFAARVCDANATEGQLRGGAACRYYATFVKNATARSSTTSRISGFSVMTHATVNYTRVEIAGLGSDRILAIASPPVLFKSVPEARASRPTQNTFIGAQLNELHRQCANSIIEVNPMLLSNSLPTTEHFIAEIFCRITATPSPDSSGCRCCELYQYHVTQWGGGRRYVYLILLAKSLG